ncbi:MAG: cytidylate kinase-like family protein [Armatimonadetes bacterium]|nr:cytidylate kinase-like family protein [Armatimonadota bacterium]
MTLARQLGCGGSSLGQRIAENLNVRCLDREIISRAAQQLALDEAELAEREERSSSFWERMLRGMSMGPPEALYHPPTALSISDRELFTAETQVMQTIAEQEDCVIVGRVAAHVLPAHPGMVNIFLYAPLSFRTQRMVENSHAADEAQARAMIAQSDESRKRFIAQMTGREWDDAKNYHLCVDTSALPLPEIADFLTDFVRRKTAHVTG